MHKNHQYELETLTSTKISENSSNKNCTFNKTKRRLTEQIIDKIKRKFDLKPLYNTSKYEIYFAYVGSVSFFFPMNYVE